MKKLLTILILVVIMIALSYMGKVSAVSVTSTDIGSKFDEYSFLNDYKRKFIKRVNEEYDFDIEYLYTEYDGDLITLFFKDNNLHHNTNVTSDGRKLTILDDGTIKDIIDDNFSIGNSESQDYRVAIKGTNSVTSLFGANAGYAKAQAGFKVSGSILHSFGETKEFSYKINIDTSVSKLQYNNLPINLQLLYNYEMDGRMYLSPGTYGLKMSYDTLYTLSITFKRVKIYNISYETITTKKLFQKPKTTTVQKIVDSGRYMYVIKSDKDYAVGDSLDYYNEKYYYVYGGQGSLEYKTIINLEDATIFYDFTKPAYEIAKIG